MSQDFSTTFSVSMQGDLAPAGNEVEHLKSQHRLLKSIIHALTTQPDFQKMLDEMLALTFQNLKDARRGVILLVNPATGGLELRSKRRHPKEPSTALPYSETVVRAAIERRECLLIANAQDDREFQMAASVQANALRALIVAPLFHQETVYGAMVVEGEAEAFRESQVHTLALMTSLMAQYVHRSALEDANRLQAIENAKLSETFSPDVVAAIRERAFDPNIPRRCEGPILYMDLVGFTALSERFPPELVQSLLNRYFEQADRLIRSLGGTIDKHIGDAVMAHWGMVEAVEQAEDRALLAALRMQNSLFSFNRELTLEARRLGLELPQLGAAMGLNSGAVIAGNLGSSCKKEFTVIGPAVNVAARVEGASSAGAVLFAPAATGRLLSRFFAVRMQPTEVKGVEEKLVLHSMRGLETDDEGWVLSLPASFLAKGQVKVPAILCGYQAGAFTLQCALKLPPEREISCSLELPELPAFPKLSFSAELLEEVAGGLFTYRLHHPKGRLAELFAGASAGPLLLDSPSSPACFKADRSRFSPHPEAK